MSCDEPQPRSRPVFLGGKTRTDPESAWEGLLSRPLRDLGTRVSHHAYTHALESLFEKYQAASRLSIKRVIATYTNVSLVVGNSS